MSLVVAIVFQVTEASGSWWNGLTALRVVLLSIGVLVLDPLLLGVKTGINRADVVETLGPPDDGMSHLDLG